METLFTGRNIIELPECASVNTHATELLKAVKLPEGTVIYTKKQTSGRGQRGNTWVSEHGQNLTMCFVFHPNFLNAANSFLLSMTVSLALHDLLTELLTEKQEIKIKWPNDILVDGKKVAGILIENILREQQISSSVVGIGLNLNQDEFSSLNGKAASLKSFTKTEINIDDALKKLCGKTEKRYLQLRSGQNEKLKEEYLKKLWLFGKEHWYLTPAGQKINGWITDVCPDGKMILQTENEGEKKFSMKEIIF